MDRGCFETVDRNKFCSVATSRQKEGDLATKSMCLAHHRFRIRLGRPGKGQKGHGIDPRLVDAVEGTLEHLRANKGRHRHLG